MHKGPGSGRRPRRRRRWRRVTAGVASSPKRGWSIPDGLQLLDGGDAKSGRCHRRADKTGHCYGMTPEVQCGDYHRIYIYNGAVLQGEGEIVGGEGCQRPPGLLEGQVILLAEDRVHCPRIATEGDRHPSYVRGGSERYEVIGGVRG